MRILPAGILTLAIAAPALGQDAMTHSVTPRDVAWYMTHPDVLDQTLQVCHSNSAYGPTPDCQNAERAGAGLMGKRYGRAAATGAALYQDPAYWDANPAQRAGVLAQCRRRAPGDELVFLYCKPAAASESRSLNRPQR